MAKLKVSACKRKPLFMAYYRAWRDKTMRGVNTSLPDENWLTMNDIPYGIDIVNVFSYIPAGQEGKAQPFFEELRENYVPTLHQRGVKITRAIDYCELLKIKQTGKAITEKEFDIRANELLDTFVRPYNIDGLDIDMEAKPCEQDIEISDGVIKALSKYIGPKANNGTVLVYDTNTTLISPIVNVADCFTYLGYQQYGSDHKTTENALLRYAEVIPAEKFMPGLTFPEEQDMNNRWYDAVEPYQTSNLYKVAKFTTEHNLFGMFVYALDRDGRTYDDDDFSCIKRSNFLWTKTAILEVRGYTLEKAKKLAMHFIERNVRQINDDDLIRRIMEATTIYDVNKVLLASREIKGEKDSIACIFDPIYEEQFMNSK